ARGRRAVAPAADDQVLLTPGDVEITIGVDAREIAGEESVLGNRLQPVARREIRAGHLRSADEQLAFLARAARCACLAHDRGDHVLHRRADRAPTPRVRRVAGPPAGLCHAAALADPGLVAGLALDRADHRPLR